MPPLKPALFTATIYLLLTVVPCAQVSESRSQARLRGSVTLERSWWDVKHYDLSIEVFPQTQTVKGINVISFTTVRGGQTMQIDLQPPLKITEVKYKKKALQFEREDNVYWIRFASPLRAGVDAEIKISFEGEPTKSRKPPWSGGFSWKKDSKGKPFIATTCQGIGASIWWPNKDHGYDEPDRGMTIAATVPSALTAVANGRLKKVDRHKDTRTFHWEVTNPINNYCVNLNIGNYVRIPESYKGKHGRLDMEYWVLEQDRARARKHFIEAPRTIEALEHWFGKYPFYEDSYKLVQVPYLGMEHQSSVTYGNGFRNGYKGDDLSGTGVGLKFDFIIIHESAHEWFGNNISMKDAADMWIHESFANYAESLFVEYHFTRKEAEDYVIGTRRRIRNDRPIIGKYGLNREGSGDMYYKGGNMLHTLRHVINDDARWLQILRGLNTTFWHQTVTTEQVENYIASNAGVDLRTFFEQYLRTTKVPTVRYSFRGKTLSYHFDKVVEGFTMPIKVWINGKPLRLRPTTEAQKLEHSAPIMSFAVDRNFYVHCRERHQE